MRFVFIADESAAYTGFQKDRTLDAWGVERKDTCMIKTVKEIAGGSLFGAAPVSILQLESKEMIQAELEALKGLSSEEIERFSKSGLIILSNVSRKFSQTFEKVVREIGGTVVLSKDLNPSGSPLEGLLQGTSLSSEVKNFLIGYAGDDYSPLLGLVKSLSDLTPKQQQLITLDEIAIRLPTGPGGIPPWAIETALFAGDMTKAIETYRRFESSSVLLVPLFILKGKFRLMVKVAALLQSNSNLSTASAAKLLSGTPMPLATPKETTALIKKLEVKDNYTLKLALGQAKKFGLIKLTRCLSVIAETESAVKGGESGDPNVYMELMLLKINAILRS